MHNSFFSRLDKLESSTDSWSIFVIKNILFVNKIKIKVINNTTTSTSNFALPDDCNQL